MRGICMRSVSACVRQFGLAISIRHPAPEANTYCLRFESALRLNVHFHSVVLDGVHGDEEDPLLRDLPQLQPSLGRS